MMSFDKKTISAVFLATCLLLSFNGIDYVNLGDQIRDGKYRYLLYGCCPILFIFLKDRLTWAPAFFGSLALFSFVSHHYLYYGAFPLVLITACLLFSAYVVKFDKETFGKILMYSGLAQAFLAIYQGLWIKWYTVGLMGHETVFGPFVVAALAPALWNSRWIISVILMVAALCTGSSMTILSLSVLLLVFIWSRYGIKSSIGVGSIGCVVIGLLYLFLPELNLFSFNGRYFIWDFGIRAFKESPWFGSGIGSWSGNFLQKYKDEILLQFRYHVPFQLHSDYLQFLVEYGITPFIVLLYSLVQFVVSFRPTWTHAVCAAILVNALASFPFYIMPLAVIFVVCWTYSMREAYSGEMVFPV